MAPGGGDIIAVTCTAAFGVSIVARLSRDDFTQIAVQRMSIPVDHPDRYWSPQPSLFRVS
jgi:hypothetical protein